MIVVASGFDASAFDPLGRMMLNSECYRRLAEKPDGSAADALCGGRIAMTHEGGLFGRLRALLRTCGDRALAGVRTEVVDPLSDHIVDWAGHALHAAPGCRDRACRRGAADSGGAALPAGPDRDMDFAVTTLLNALTLISIFSLVGLGLAISFGLMNVTNLAHGEFVTVGAFAVYFVQHAGRHFWLGLLAAPRSGRSGRPASRGSSSCAGSTIARSAAILATWGVSLVLQQSLELIFGLGAKPVVPPVDGTADLGVTVYPAYRLILIGIAILDLALVALLVRRTRFGLDIRTVIQNREMAEAVGIDTRFTYAVAFTFGAAVAGLAGALVSPLATVLPQMGVNYLANAFFVVIVGGAGSLAGLLAGSTFVGGLTSILNYQISPSLAQALVLLAAIVIVRFRPNGLAGARR